MKKISNYTLIGIFILIIVALTFYFVEVREANAEIATVGVVIATQDIDSNQVITADMVKVDNRYTEDQLKEQGNITSELSKVIGKRSKAPIYKGETIKLQRVIENRSYMNPDQEKKGNIFSMVVGKTDKALDIKKGDYIDIWLEPNDKALEKYKDSRKLFEKIRIEELKSENHAIYTQGNNDDEALGYILINLDSQETKQLLDVLGSSEFSVRITHYGEHRNYEIETEVFIEDEVIEIDEEEVEEVE